MTSVDNNELPFDMPKLRRRLKNMQNENNLEILNNATECNNDLLNASGSNNLSKQTDSKLKHYNTSNIYIISNE